jgi:nitroreductase
MDRFQDRYRAHQARKATVLAQILAERHSERRFDPRPIGPDVAGPLLAAALCAPSSCDRRGVSAVEVTGRDRLALLGGLLVGGVGWVHRAPLVWLLMADRAAYKAPGEVDFMPFLDAGFVAQSILLAASAGGLSACFVNPSVRAEHRAYFADAFGADLFCGAVAVGFPHSTSG